MPHHPLATTGRWLPALGLAAAVILAAPAAAQSAAPATTPEAPASASGLPPSERNAILAAATQAAHARLKLQPGALRLSPEQMQRDGQWAFLISELRAPTGERFNYAGTDLQAAAQAGGVSSVCAALLKRDGQDPKAPWRVVDIAVGPTDLAWEAWPTQHQAPTHLFQLRQR